MNRGSITNRNPWVPPGLTGGSILAVLAISLFSLTSGISTVFMHLYYLPLVLIGYFYRRRGIPLIVALSGTYFLMVVWFDRSNPVEIGAAALRACMFVITGSVVALLSEHLSAESTDLEQIIADMQDPVYRADVDGNLLMATPSWAALLGYSSVEECIGKNLARDFYLNPADRDVFLRELGKDGRVTGFPVTLRRRDGRPVPVSTSSHYWYGPDGKVAGIEGVFRDVTRQQQLERDLRESEARYREFFTTSRDCVFITTPEGQWIDFNDSALDLFGYTRREELLAVPIGDLYALAKDRERIVRQIVSDGYVRDFPARLKRRDGSLIDALITTVAVRNADGTVRHFTGTVRDITEHKRIVEALQASEEKFRQFFNNVNDAVYVHRLHPDGRPGRIVEANDVMCLRLGYTRDELLAMEMPDLIAGDGKEKIPDIAARIRHDGHATFETYHRAKDGSAIPVEVSTHLFVQKGEQLALASARDITERNHAADALRQSEEKFRNIFDRINDAVHIHGVDDQGLPQRIIAVNDAACSMLHYTRDELLTMSPLDLVTGYHSRPLEEIGKELSENGQAIFETEHIRKDSVVIPVEINARVSTLAGERVVVSVVRDITERKHAENALRKSEKRYRSLFDNMQEGFAYCRMIYDENGVPSDFVYLAINRAFDRIIGAGTVIGRPVTEVFPGIRQAFPQLFEIYGRVARTGVAESFDLDFSPAGKWLHISVYSPARDYFVAVFSDITASRQAEESLRKSEQNLRENQVRLANAMDLAHMVNWEFDIRTGLFTFDRRFYALYGTTPEREGGTQVPAEIYVKEFVHPDDAEGVTRIIRETLELKDPLFSAQAEHRIIRRDGEIRHIVVRFSVILDDAGNLVKTYGVNQDITERRKMEESLRDSERRLLDIINFLPDPTFVIDREGRVIAWNLAISALTGTAPEAIIGRGDYEYSFQLFGYRRPLLIDLVIHPSPQVFQEHYRNVQRTGDQLSGRFHVPSLLGKPADLWIVATPLLNAAGEITGAIESIRDITEIRRTENALRDLNLTLEQRVRERTQELENARMYTRSLIEADLDPLVLIGPVGNIQDVNSAAERMTGESRDALIGTSFLDHVREKDQARDGFGTALREGIVTGNRYSIIHREGTVTPVMASAVLFRDNSGSPAGVFVSLHDITRILQDEEQINTQLKEKEVLLREVHHRVKNNLQIIVSLISLQTRTLHDPETLEALRDTQNRVRAIAIVHEHLHLSKELGTVDFGVYVRYLATSLYSFYQKNPADIRLSVSVSDVILDIDTASPLGLVFNELISNMLKYAFPGGRKGECAITAHRDGRSVVLAIRDDGVGMPEDLDWQNSPTLGLRLVHILIEQLNGTIFFARDSGTRVTITLTLPEKATGIHHVGGL